MSQSVHGQTPEPIDIQQSATFPAQDAKAEDPGTQTIRMLAMESLTMGSEESQAEGEIHATLDLGEAKLTETIENVRSELFGVVDSDLEDLAGMLDLNMDEIEEIMNTDDLMGMFGLDEADLEEMTGAVFIDEGYEIVELSEVELQEKIELATNTIALVRDPETGRTYLKPFNDDYIKQNPHQIVLTFDGKQATGKKTYETAEIAEFLESAEIDSSIDTKLIEALKIGDYEMVMLTESDWNKHIQSLFMDLLGIRVDEIAQNQFERPEKSERETTPIEEHSVSNYREVQDSDYMTSETIVALPAVMMNGMAAKILSDLINSLNELKQIHKNEEKQEIQRQVLIYFLRLKRLQAEIMFKSEKKEKIWFENTTSFLRFLLRRDIKLIHRLKKDIKSSIT